MEDENGLDEFNSNRYQGAPNDDRAVENDDS